MNSLDLLIEITQDNPENIKKLIAKIDARLVEIEKEKCHLKLVE